MQEQERRASRLVKRRMGVYRKSFESEDEYEAWSRRAGERITVLSVRSAEAPRSRSGLAGHRMVLVTYQTNDASVVSGEESAEPSMRAVTLVAVAGILGLVWLLTVV
jgi:hypothetical protein